MWLRAQENSKKRSLSEIQSRKRRFSWRKGRQFRKNRSPFVGRRFSKSIFDKPGNGEATCAAPQVFNLSRGSFAFGPLPPVPAEILRISGRGSWKETIFALGSEISRRKNRPAPAVHAAGDGYSAKGLRPSRAPLWGFDSRHAPKGFRRTYRYAQKRQTLFQQEKEAHRQKPRQRRPGGCVWQRLGRLAHAPAVQSACALPEAYAL